MPSSSIIQSASRSATWSSSIPTSSCEATGADADVVAIDQLGDVVRVQALDRKRRQAAAGIGLRRSVDAQPSHFGQAFEQMAGELDPVQADALHAQPVEIIDRRAERDGL